MIPLRLGEIAVITGGEIHDSSDGAGADLLVELHHAIRERGMAFRVAEAHGQMREALRRIGFEGDYGPVEANQTVSAVLQNWKGETRIGTTLERE